MKTLDMIPLLASGKKFRKKDWPSNVHLKSNPQQNGIFPRGTSPGFCYRISDSDLLMNSDDWEEYNEAEVDTQIVHDLSRLRDGLLDSGFNELAIKADELIEQCKGKHPIQTGDTNG